MSDVLSKEEKIKILKAIEEDIEFRYAIAGALGILDILRRLDAIEKRLEELTKTIEEHNKRLEEHSKRLEELTKTIEEHNKRLEEHSKRLEELTKTIEEHNKRLEEHSKRLEELTNVVTMLVKRTSDLEQTIGGLTEASIARYVYEDLAKDLSHKGEHILKRVRNARLDDVDIDLLIETNRSVYVVEVKVKPRHGDIGILLSKIDLVKKHYIEKEVVGILAGVWIGKEVENYAKEKGIVVYIY